MPETFSKVQTYRPGSSTPRAFGEDQWRRLQNYAKKKGKTNGYVQLGAGQSIPKGQVKVPVATPPEVTSFPLKTKRELEADLRKEIGNEFQVKLEAVQAEANAKQEAMQQQLAELISKMNSIPAQTGATAAAVATPPADQTTSILPDETTQNQSGAGDQAKGQGTGNKAKTPGAK